MSEIEDVLAQNTSFLKDLIPLPSAFCRDVPGMSASRRTGGSCDKAARPIGSI